jgi:hypothetical protein
MFILMHLHRHGINKKEFIYEKTHLYIITFQRIYDHLCQ